MTPGADRSALKRSQPSSPASPTTDKKKPRHTETVIENSDAPTTPTKVVDATPSTATAMSPPNRRDAHHTPASSPGAQETQGTQIESQSTYLGNEAVKETDPDVWGYLDPITDTSQRVIKLNKSPDANYKSNSSASSRVSKKNAKVSGFLIGRHAECDLRINHSVISNRHCLIYKEISGSTPKAVLEDLSSNGTWVNGVIIGRNKSRELTTGDEVEFAGGWKYHFRYLSGISDSRFRDRFELGPPLGSGHFATVYTAVEKNTGSEFAVKIFKKKRAEEASYLQGLKSEIAMLMSVSHPNVLCLKGTYDEDDGVYLVLELAPEGELFNYIIKNERLTEDESRKVFKQLLNGLKYLHERNIVHRDIKPENILLLDKQLTVKLADFGLAKIIGEDSFTTSLCGTPSYVAPEILETSRNRKYTRAVDIWSLGVVLYICLCGFPPFSDELYTPENPFTLSHQIKRGHFEFPSPYWDHVSDCALDLIERMIEVNPARRITVDEALRHPWITEATYNPGDSCGSLTSAIENLGFVRKKVTQERTLLAKAPGLSSSLPGPSKSPVEIHQDTNGNQEAKTKAEED